MVGLGTGTGTNTSERAHIPPAHHPPQPERDDPDLATYHVNLAEVLRRLKRLDEAEQLARMALDVQRAHPRGSHREDRARQNPGRSRRVTEAEPLLRDALTIRRERLGGQHPEVKRAAAEHEQLQAGAKK